MSDCDVFNYPVLMRTICLCTLLCLGTDASLAAPQSKPASHSSEKPRSKRQLPFTNTGPFAATDTIDVSGEPDADARDCLEDTGWDPKKFEVQLDRESKSGDCMLRFPSPRPAGNEKNDTVCVEWYMARTSGGKLKDNALPVVVVHELGSNMAAGKAVATGLSRIGLHAFMVQLPSYGERRVRRRAHPAEMLKPMQQAIADVRRTRDAIVRLPTVDTRHIALQGTSLGGIIAASSGSLDDGFDSVHLLLAGGDLFNLIKTGKRDTAYVRASLERAGVTDEQLKQLTAPIEPNRIAHRLPRGRTWLYSGKNDTVIPKANANALATAAKIEKSHHKWYNVNHYSGMVMLPWILADVGANIRKLTEKPKTDSGLR